MVRRVLAFLGAIALIASIGAVTAGPAAALNVVTVTNTADDDNDSLRDAFSTANSDTDDTEIVLTAGATYTLTKCDQQGGEDANSSGDLDHTASHALTITGNGATIRQTCEDRVIDNNETGTITLNNVTVTGGDEPDGDGGGLQSDAGGNVVVTDSTFTMNQTEDDGGAIDIGEDDGPSADLTATNSTFTDNTANTGDGVEGEGGAIHQGDGDGGTMTITDTVFRGNEAEGGGAINNGDGGTAILTRVTIDDNEATDDDSGAVDNGDGSTLTITHSTLSNNTAAQEGGAIENDSAEQLGGAQLTITNSTLSGNTAAEGGAIDNGAGANASLHNVTVTNNTTSDGGALQNADTGTFSLRMTIVANNPGGDCSNAQPFNSAGWNIDGDDSCDLGAEGDKPSTDPVLGALAANGGPTLTHLPLAGSPAIDMGTNDRCPADDQRGISRPQDGLGDGEAICDIGAVEVVYQAPPDTTTTTEATTTTAAASPQALAPTFTG